MATKEQMERVAQAIQAKILNIYPENRESDAAALVIAQTAIAALDIPALEQAAYDLGFASGQASIDDALGIIPLGAKTKVLFGNDTGEQLTAVLAIPLFSTVFGHGATRVAAILDACRKAKGVDGD